MASSLGFTLVVLFAAPLLGKCELRLNPGCKVETLRSCGDDFVPYKNGPHLPESGQELDEVCKKNNNQMKCALKFINDCTPGLFKAAALVAVKALEEDNDAVCTVGSEAHNNYLKGIKCMNSQGAKLHKCIKNLNDFLNCVVAKAPTKDAIPYTCCSYHDLADCLFNALTSCESVGSQDYMARLVQEMFGDTLSLVCGRYQKGSTECKSLPKLPNLDARDRRTDNIVELLLEIGGTLGLKN